MNQELPKYKSQFRKPGEEISYNDKININDKSLWKITPQHQLEIYTKLQCIS